MYPQFTQHLRTLQQGAAGLVLSLAALNSAYAAENPLSVFVSVIPQQYFAEQVGGEAVTAEAMVKPDFSPATYEPTGQQIARLSKADLYVRIGVPFENGWMERIASVNKRMPIVDAREGLELLEQSEHAHHDHEHDEHAEHEEHSDHDKQAEHEEHSDHDEHAEPENEFDPHVWTSPRLAKKMAAQMQATFSELRPEQAEQFAENYQAFAAQLDELDAELTALFAESDVEQFMVYHPAWGYFADAYGLRQVPIESEGKEPGARALAELIERAKAENVKAIFVQPQFSQKAAKQVAKAIDGQVITIDPLAPNYIENLRQVGYAIVGQTAPVAD